MLRQLEQQKPQNSILGPDGQPVGPEPTVDPKAAMERAKKEYEDQQKKRVDDLHKRLVELTTNDREALDLSSVILCSHRLIHWAKAELYGRCGVEDDLIEFMDRWMSHAAEGDRGFTLKKAIADIKHQCVPIAEHFRKLNEAQQGLRMKKLSRLAKHLDLYGIALPTEQLNQKMGKCFRLGEILVLHGEAEPAKEVARYIMTHQSSKVGRVYWLTSEEPIKEDNEDGKYCVMPGSWWHDSASHIRKLYTNLQSFTNDEAALIVIDDLEQMLTSVDAPLAHRKQVALVRLYQWARECAAAVVVVNKDSEPADPRFYGRIPYASVKQGAETDGTLVPYIDGVPLE